MKAYISVDNVTSSPYSAQVRVVSEDQKDVMTVPNGIGIRLLTVYEGHYTVYVTKKVPAVMNDRSIQYKEYIISKNDIILHSNETYPIRIDNDYVRARMTFEPLGTRVHQSSKKYIEHLPYRQDSLLQPDPYPYGQLSLKNGDGQYSTESYQNFLDASGRQWSTYPRMGVPRFMEDYYYGMHNRSVNNNIDPANTERL